MKFILKLFLIFILSLFKQPAFCQSNYVPFPTDSAVWHIIYYDFVVNPCHINEEYLYYLNGDTVINNITYQKIYKETIMVNCNPSNQTYLYRLIRQDILTKRVYVLWNQSDTLLFDFNLNVGDTLSPSFVNPDVPVQIIDFIDSMQLYDGTYRHRFHLSPGRGGISNDSLIEGIGTLSGLFDISSTVAQFSLNCFSINDTLLYSWTSNCSIPLNLDDFTSRKLIKMWPIPATSLINISSDQVIDKMTILSMDKLIISNIKINYSESTVDISSLTSGIYLIKIEMSNVIEYRLFIKL